MRTFTPELDRLLELLLVLDVRGGERVDLLEHARHRREVGRADLGDVRDDHLRVARPIGERYAEVEGRELDQDRERMGERQEEVRAVAAAENSLLCDRAGDRAIVGVREQAPLGRPRGAGGVDVKADVLRGDGLVAGRPLGIVAAAPALAQSVQGDRVTEVRVARVHHDHVPQLRAAVLDLADLGELSGVLDEDRARVGVLEDVLALLRGVRLVDRDERGAGGEDAEAGIAPLGTGVGEDRDLLARLDTEIHQAQRDLLDDLAELGVRDVDPLLADLVAQRGRIRVLPYRQRQQVGDGLRPGASRRPRCPP